MNSRQQQFYGFLCGISLMCNLAVRADDFVHLPKIEQSAIEQQRRKIDTLVNRHRNLALGITGMLVASQILQLFALYQYYNAPALPIDVVEQKKSLVASVKEQMSLGLRGIKEGVYALPGIITTSITTGSFIWPTLNLVKEFGIYCGVQCVADLFLETVHHRDDVHWYMRHYAPLINTITIAQEQIGRLMKSGEHTLTAGQRVRYTRLLAHTLDDLVQETTNLLGFIEHKKIQLTSDAQQKVSAVSDFIFHYANDWIDEVNHLLMDGSLASIDTLLQLQGAVLALKNEIVLHGKQFATYEKQLRKTSLWNRLLH